MAETFLLRANELEARHPVVAYRLKIHYLDIAMSDFTGFDKALVGELLREAEQSKAALPRNATGKVLKRTLRDQYVDASQPAIT